MTQYHAELKAHYDTIRAKFFPPQQETLPHQHPLALPPKPEIKTPAPTKVRLASVMPLRPMRRVSEAVAEEFNLPVEMLRGGFRRKYYSTPRWIAYRLCRELEPAPSLIQIAVFFGRDHTSIMHGLKALPDRIAYDPSLSERIERVKARLNQGNEWRPET